MNFAARILDACRAQPQRLALVAPQWRDGVPAGETRLTYGELQQQIAGWQQALQAAGFAAGDRVVVLVPPSPALYALMTALLASGIVPVLIERGMSRLRIAQSLRAGGARAVIGDVALLRRWWLFPPLWSRRRYAVDGRGFGLRPLQPATTVALPVCVDRGADDHGIITFTSGSTGAPKGADRTHGSLVAQHLAIREHWPDRDDDIDCTCFPVLVLHNLCCGIGTVLPEADLGAPGRADPARIAAQLQRERVTRLSAAPAFLQRLVLHCRTHDIRLPQLRSVIVGGATLSRPLAENCAAVFPQAHCRVVYGSTEAEPIADVDLPELVRDWDAQPGHLVGRPAHAATVAVVDPAATLRCEADIGAARRADGTTGEILVAGAHVLRAYLDNPEATRESKIPRTGAHAGTVWHRTGDAGFLDAQGRLWLVGRVKDAVSVDGTARYTFPLEKAVDALPGVERSALVADTGGRPVLVVAGRIDRAALQRELARHGFPGARIVAVPAMPVDGRHNSKIDRPTLRALLAREHPP
ncbi:MAG: fatty acid CoA ligase family protein [Pseudomonadota bacterium]